VLWSQCFGVSNYVGHTDGISALQAKVRQAQRGASQISASDSVIGLSILVGHTASISALQTTSQANTKQVHSRKRHTASKSMNSPQAMITKTGLIHLSRSALIHMVLNNPTQKTMKIFPSVLTNNYATTLITAQIGRGIYKHIKCKFVSLLHMHLQYEPTSATT
jgi:hypothetical protein